MPTPNDVIEVLKHRIRTVVKPLYADMVEETLDRFIDLWCEQHRIDEIVPAHGLEAQLDLIEELGHEAALSEALNAVLGLPHCLGEDAEA